MTAPIRGDLTRTVLAVLFIGGLIVTSFWILRPFIGATIWATTIVAAITTLDHASSMRRRCAASPSAAAARDGSGIPQDNKSNGHSSSITVRNEIRKIIASRNNAAARSNTCA